MRPLEVRVLECANEGVAYDRARLRGALGNEHVAHQCDAAIVGVASGVSPRVTIEPHATRQLVELRRGATEPGVAQLRSTANRRLDPAGEPDRWARSLHRARGDRGVRHAIMPSLVRDAFLGPEALDQRDRLVHPAPAFLRRHVEGLELLGRVAGPDTGN